MPPALGYFTEHSAAAFAAAARRSRRLHGRWVHPPTTESEAKDLQKRRVGPNDFGFLIFEYGTGDLAGYIEITNIVRGCFQSAYLGYYIFRGYERRGYMSWALAEMVKRAWKDLKLHRLEANIQPENIESIKLVQKLGFQKEGFSPAYLKIAGRWRDHERWAILAR
jgi:[ribosomal protein S5]-alanine N-acetyltransferase